MRQGRTLTEQPCARCGHAHRWHRAERNGKSTIFPCVWCDSQMRFCRCKNFKVKTPSNGASAGLTGADEDQSNKENSMDRVAIYTQRAAASTSTKPATKTKTSPKAHKKSNPQGRKPTLAPFVDGAFAITASYKNKTFEAMVNSDGTITMDEKTYTSPSSAGKAAIKKSVDGWVFWKFKKDGKEVSLDTLRGHKSPLDKSEA